MKEEAAIKKEAAVDDTAAGIIDSAKDHTGNKDVQPKAAGCCCTKDGDERHTYRNTAEKKALMRRLSIIEGQIRGIRGMLDNDCYCIDILTQVSAATSALNCFSRELLSEHLKNCVREDVQEGHDDKLDEVIRILPKLMK